MERGVLVQRSMGPRLIIVGSVRTYEVILSALRTTNTISSAGACGVARIAPGYPVRSKKLKLPKDRQFVELRCKLAEAPENVR